MTDLRKAAEQALDALTLIDEAMPFPVAKHAITALREALAAPDVPPGYALVPVNPTPEMLRAACNAIRWYEKEVTARSVYAAMLAAAPQPKDKP